jgi:uncharacterized membrane protein
MRAVAAYPEAPTRYRRSLVLCLLGAVLIEIGIFLVFGLLMYPGGDWIAKFLWTVVFCGVGMGAVLGAAINLFVLDRLSGWNAVLATTAWSVALLGIGCNLLCYRLDANYFQYFGGQDNAALFLGNGVAVSAIGGLCAGWLLFSVSGTRLLTRLGL